jgi:hypothetical protein
LTCTWASSKTLQLAYCFNMAYLLLCAQADWKFPILYVVKSPGWLYLMPSTDKHSGNINCYWWKGCKQPKKGLNALGFLPLLHVERPVDAVLQIPCPSFFGT